MRKTYAIIENGKVTNIAVSESPLEANWIESEIAKMGDSYADGVFTTPEPLPPTDEELKKTGIEILGVMCSATKEDQNGMIAIGFDKLTNTLAGTQMGSTTMEFENGSELVITDENFSEVDALWRPFRKSFF